VLVAGTHQTVKQMHNNMKSSRIFLLLLLLLPAGAFCLRAQEDSLRHYLDLAAANSPLVGAAYLAFEASLQKLPQAGAYADPTLEAGVFPSPMELAGGRQIAEFRLMQMFPWFGTRKAARTEAQHMANMAFEQFRETRDNLLAEVGAQWYTLCALRQQLIYSEANRQWIEQLEQLALRRFTSASPPGAYASGENPPSVRAGASASSSAPSSSGGMNMVMQPSGAGAMPQSDSSTGSGMSGMSSMNNTPDGMSGVLAIQLEKMESDSRIESLHAAIQAETARFNALLNRPAESRVALPDSLAPIPFLPDMPALAEEINARNPMLNMLHEEALAHEAKGHMSRKMEYPMLGAGLQYMLMAPLENTAGEAMNGMDASPEEMMNGKDMLMPMLSVSIPLYRNKYKAAQRESLLMRRASEAKRADALNRLEAELHRLVFLLNDAARSIDLYRRQASATRSAASLALQEFVSGRTGLDGVIQIQRRLLDYRLKEAEATAAYNTAVTNIRKMISSLTSE
jgi:outer membrane protein TolC